MAYKAGECSVEGCGPTSRLHKGLCCGHYQRFKKYGTATGHLPTLITSEKRVRPIDVDGDIARVPLTQGKFAVIDAADAAEVGRFNWSAIEDNRTFYAKAYIDGRSIPLHQFLMGLCEGKNPDHRDNDGLNNRRSNLRFATLSQNQANKRRSVNNRSGYKGVHEANIRAPKRWRASITKAGKFTSLGYFYSPEEAARAYDKAACALHGEFARLNFGRV